MGGEQRVLELPSQGVQHKYSPQPEHHMLRLPDNLLQQGFILSHFQQALLVRSSRTSGSPFPRHSHWSGTETRSIGVDICPVHPPQQLVERVLKHVAVIIS